MRGQHLVPYMLSAIMLYEKELCTNAICTVIVPLTVLAVRIVKWL
jgi:hypothetical protein